MPVRVTPEIAARDLGMAVLESALDDYAEGTCFFRDDALNFFESGDFEVFANWAGYDPWKLIEGMRAKRKELQDTLKFY
jgi:hypothetical protein